jgi:hypothetical protein
MEQINELAGALSKAQAEFPPIPKTRTAKVLTKTGREYEYNYADLSDILKAVLPVLSKHGLAITQAIVEIDGSRKVATTLMHVSGQCLKGCMSLPNTDKAQELGAVVTYYRRYSLCGILGIAAEDDLDGEPAHETVPRQRQKTDAKPEPKQAPKTEPWKPGQAELAEVKSLVEQHGWNGITYQEHLHRVFKKAKLSELNLAEYAKLLEGLRSGPTVENKPAEGLDWEPGANG